MKKYFLSLFILAVCINGNGQSPDWQWAKSTGGLGNDWWPSISVDNFGNTYSTGMFEGTVDFDPGPGVVNLVGAGISDAFISKINNAGNLVWAKKIGGPSDLDGGMAITTDQDGYIYIAGNFSATVDFDPGPGTFNLSCGTSTNVFVAKFDTSGNFIWVKQIGKMWGSANASAICLDALKNIYVTGDFGDTIDFDPDTSAYVLSSVSGDDDFTLKLDSAGHFEWVKQMGEFSTIFCNTLSIKVGNSGNSYAVGFFRGSVDIDPGPNTVTITSASSLLFIRKLDPAGNFIWAKTWDAFWSLGGVSIALDPDENIYGTGCFIDSVDFDPDTSTSFYLTATGYKDVFLLKIDSAGDFNWATSMGGNNINAEATGTEIKLDALGNLFVAGNFTFDIDLDPGVGVSPFSASIYKNIFLAKYTNTGNFLWADAIGGSLHDMVSDLALDGSFHVYLTGTFYSHSMEFDSTLLINADVIDTTPDFFLARLKTCRSHFTVYPDTIPHNWLALNEANGVPPLNYLWNWGDGNTSTGAYPSHTYADSGYYAICLTVNDITGCQSTYCDSSTFLFRSTSEMSMVTINGVGQILTDSKQELYEERDILIYPNPAGSQLTISSWQAAIKTIEIFNTLGEKVLSVQSSLRSAKPYQTSIDISALPASIYFVKVQTEKGAIVKKLVVE